MTVQIADDRPAQFTIQTALMIYEHESKENPYSSEVKKRHTVTRHTVRKEKDGRLVLGPGDFVTRTMVDSLLNSVDASPLTYVPPNVVAISRSAIAWWEHARPRVMFFKPVSDKAVLELDGTLVPQPPVLFIAGRRKLAIYALPTDERPTLDTALMQAPYWNIFQNNNVCQGSMVYPESVDPKDTADWSDSFYRSAFTGLNTGARWKFKGSYKQMLDQAIADGSFNLKWLIPAGVTVGGALCGI